MKSVGKLGRPEGVRFKIGTQLAAKRGFSKTQVG